MIYFVLNIYEVTLKIKTNQDANDKIDNIHIQIRV